MSHASEGMPFGADRVSDVSVGPKWWQARLSAFDSLAPPPRWSREVVADAEMHGHYERYLPLSDWLPYLRCNVEAVLPDASWMPRVVEGAAGWRSIIDFWRLLPEGWHHFLGWQEPDQWLALACALAAPARYGTGRGRYPEQLARLHELRATLSGLVLDVGCGTGQGTWEVADIVGDAATVFGVTLEPLEAWMAAKRRLPHLDAGHGFCGASGCPRPLFWAGDACRLQLRRPASLILCNGLAGGPALQSEGALLGLWQALDRNASGGCELWVANSFHGGFADANEKFRKLRPANWDCSEMGGTLVFLKADP